MPKRRPAFDSKRFSGVVVQAGAKIASALQRATIVSDHHPTTGGIRETGLRDFLRQLLPAGFYVGTGFVFDAHDSQSRQLDIVIAREPPLVGVFEQDGICYLPCEVVLAAIEVKKILTADEVRTSLDNAARIRSLKPYGNQDFTSARSRGKELPPTQHRCSYGIVAFESDLIREGWAQREWDRLKRLAGEASLSPNVVDRIAILDRGLVNTVEGVATTHPGEMKEIALNWFIHLSNHLDREAKRRPAFDPDIYRISEQWTRLK